MKTKETQSPCPPGRGLLGAILLVARELRTALDRRMAPHGLTFQQASLLIRCVHHRGANLHQLMPHLGTDDAGVSRLVDRLEDANLVERAPGSDRRAIALEPTEPGSALVPKLEKTFNDVNQELIAGLSREEVATAHELLGRILVNAEALNGRALWSTRESLCPTE